VGTGIRVVHAAADRVVLDVDGVQRTYDVAVHGDRVYAGGTALTALPRLPEPAAQEHAPGALVAPMPGTVVRLAENVAPGMRVSAGEPLLWLEAMKMEHRITAPVSGTLTALHAAPGRQIEAGALLAVVTEDPAEEPRDPQSFEHPAPGPRGPRDTTEEPRAPQDTTEEPGNP
jgi:propionyl-CoA carboxylase alpha chain